MKRSLSLNRVLFALNLLLASILLVSYVLPYTRLITHPYIAVLIFLEPVFIILNALCVVYWLTGKKVFFLVSLITLILGLNSVKKFFNISSEYSGKKRDNAIKIMTYNVRLFTQKSMLKEHIADSIIRFVNHKSPDIICFQEFDKRYADKIKGFSHRYIHVNAGMVVAGQAVFSKYPIIDKGSLDFKNTLNNNAIYADIQLPNDTVRVYNIHLESLHISNKLDHITTSDSQKIVGDIMYAFKKQKCQIDMVKTHYRKTKYKKVICGDFNNTAFSFIYQTIREDMKDSFEECGNGLGETFYLYGFIPLRIDFIMVDNSYKVLNHYNHYKAYSDHYPVIVEYMP